MIARYEVLSTAEYYTLKQNDQVTYRPTVLFAYHPCQDTMESVEETLEIGTEPLEENWKIFEQHEIVSGKDEVGVLVYGHSKNAYWYGSQLEIETTRKLTSTSNCTSLQVAAAAVAAMAWALKNPGKGWVEPEEMDYKFCLEVAGSYLTPVRGFYTDWTPLEGRAGVSEKEKANPWLYKHMIQ